MQPPEENELSGSGNDSHAPEWRLICQVLLASAAGDPVAFRSSLQQLHDEYPDNTRAKALVGFALRYQLIRRFGRLPTAAELRALALELDRGWRAVVRVDTAELEEVMGVVIGLRPATERTRKGNLTVRAAAALGLILESPDVELEELAARSSSWYEKTREARAN